MPATSFDAYAKMYDEHFTNSLIGKAQRERVYYFIEEELKHSTTILEMNCGTGEDAMYFSGRGKKVIATDISEKMIAIAKEKDRSSVVQFSVCNALHINSLSVDKTDMIFSNFGGLNCLDQSEFGLFAHSAQEKLRSDGKLIMVLFGTNCLWENLYFRLKGDKRSGRRKSREGVNTIIGETQFSTYYYSPKEVIKLFAEQFEYEQTKPIGFFLPPSYMENSMEKNTILFSILVFLEKCFARFSFMANWSDHYLIVLKKK